MKTVFASLIAGLFASAAFAQAPAPASQTQPAKPEASKPVKASIRPEPDVDGAPANEAKATGATRKAEKTHKTAKPHKKAKRETAAEAKTRPAAETK